MLIDNYSYIVLKYFIYIYINVYVRVITVNLSESKSNNDNEMKTKNNNNCKDQYYIYNFFFCIVSKNIFIFILRCTSKLKRKENVFINSETITKYLNRARIYVNVDFINS